MDSFTLTSVLRKGRTAQRVNDGRIAVSFGTDSLTYEELDERSDRIAAGLAAAGFVKGDRVGILMHNRLEWVELFFALAKLGGVMVPLNYLLKPAEIEFILRDCDANWVVSESALWDIALQALPSDRAIRTVKIGDPADPGALRWDELLSSGTELPDVTVTAGDLFLLQYTSGTTGAPKGATHTHSTVMWNSFHQILDYRVSSDDVYLVLPALCWAAGFHDIALATLWAGGRVVLTPSTGFDPERFADLVEREQVTKALLVPSVLKRILTSSVDFSRLASLRAVYSGGEPVPVSAIEDFSSRLPTCALLQCYGMSEFPTMMLFLDERDAMRKRGSAGKAARGAEIRVVDEDGKETAPGATGEIIVRSPACMEGYYGRGDATAATIVDGWMRTGDLASVDEEGFVYVVGRSKDMIISGGLNVYPAEVEAAIATHPAVIEAAVVGEPSDEWGEIGRAFVTTVPDARVAAGELDAWLRERIANFKIPKRFDMTTAPLPRTTSGKVQKFKLRERL